MKRRLIVLCGTLGVLAAGLLLAVLMNRGLQIPCLFHKFTGLLCPGCGNSRATIALLQFDFRTMLMYNLFYPLQILYVLRLFFVCAGNYVHGGRFTYHAKPDWIDIAFLSLLLIWGVVRNLI